MIDGERFGNWLKDGDVLRLLDERGRPMGEDYEFYLDYREESHLAVVNLLRQMAAKEVSREDLMDLAEAIFAAWWRGDELSRFDVTTATMQ